MSENQQGSEVKSVLINNLLILLLLLGLFFLDQKFAILKNLEKLIF